MPPISFMALWLLLISSVAMMMMMMQASSSAACHPPDREALLSFARDAGLSVGDLGWSGDNCCSWRGVTCTNITTSSSSSSSTVTSSLLRVSQLHPSTTNYNYDHDSWDYNSVSTNVPFQFPTSLCNLSALSVLELPIKSTAVREQQPPLRFPHCPLPLLNSFSFSLELADQSVSSFFEFPIMTTFSNLQFLDLEYIQFDNQSLLDSFTRMSPSLVSLTLTSCFSVRSFLTLPFPNLTTLHVSSCSLPGPLPPFTTMPLLETLSLFDNQLNCTLENFTLLSNLSALKDLEISDASLSGSLPAFTISHRFPSLQRLALSSNNLRGTLPDHALSLQNLTTLYLGDNRFSGPFPAIDAPLLQKLYLSDNRFAGALPKDWQLLQRLEVLDLSGTTILAASEDVTPPPRRLPEWLFKLPRLYLLDLSDTGLQAADFECEGMLSLLNQTLEVVYLQGNNLTGPGILDCFARHNFSDRLQHIDLSSNPLAFSLSTSDYVRQIGRPFEIDIIYLQNCSLWGSIPIQLMCHMTVLDLSFNNFTSLNGLAEDCGRNGSNLQYLDLSHNKLRGPILSWLSTQTLPYLMRVVLNDNSLEGSIPFELGATLAVGRFQTLKLSNNRLTGIIPSSICQITSLKLLDLSENRLEGDFSTLFSSLKKTTKLRALLLSHNRINGSIPPFFGALTPKLQLVDLSYNKLSGAIPTNLHLPALLIAQEVYKTKFVFNMLYEEVHIVVNGIMATYKYELVGLTSLDVSNNLLSGKIPAQLGEFVGLRHLNLSNNNLSGSIPENFSKLRVLESMDLSSNQLQGQIPLTFSKLQKLAKFDVSFNRALAGPIPEGSAFEDDQSFRGDVGLCARGGFILKACIQGTSTSTSKPEGDSNNPYNHAFTSIMPNWLGVPGLCLGFVVGFVGALWALHARSSPFKNVLRLKLRL